MQEVAVRAGVSAMTVSRVLRDQPKVTEATRERVLASVEALGYEADPHIGRLMQQIRSRKRRPVRAVIAVLREEPEGDSLSLQSYQFVPLDTIRDRARAYGYEAEEFWLGREGMTPSRLRRILQARGVEAVIVSPQSEQLPCSHFDYSGFAAATFGFAMRNPTLHTAATNLHLGMQLATSKLSGRGYRRIGLAITEWIDQRVQNGYTSGLFQYHRNSPEKNHVPVLLLPPNQISHGFSSFKKWMDTHRPDAVISFDQNVPEWLTRLGKRIPQDIGFLVHDLSRDQTGFSGLDHQRNELARAAVDLVVTQLSQFESGVPESPRQILVPPKWIEGPSIKSKGEV